MSENKYILNLAFARGYYDGRTKGWEDVDFDELSDYEKESYGQGYDAGLNDYELMGD